MNCSKAEGHQIVNIMKVPPRNAHILAQAIGDVLEIENGLFLVPVNAVILEHSSRCQCPIEDPVSCRS